MKAAPSERQHWLSNINIYLILGGPLFLFGFMVGPMKFLIFTSLVITVMLSYRNVILENVSKEIFNFFQPWIPWFCGIVILCMVHGISGFSKYFNFYLIMFAGALAIPSGGLKRSFVCTTASCSVLILTTLIVVDYVLHGLSSYFLGVNKNTLMGGVLLLASISFSSLMLRKEDQTTILKSLVICSFAMVCFCIYITEVRTALLGLVGMTVVIFFRTYRYNRKVFYIVMMGLIFAVGALVLSGRIGQGISDVKLWLEGNSNTSWGIRLELWLLSIKAFISKPVFGWGAHPFSEIVASGLGFPQAIGFIRHFHSDFFNMLCTGGLVGILSWLGTVCLILKRSWNDISLLMLMATILLMGLSDRYWFDMQQVLYLFACLFISLYKSREISNI